MVKQKKNLNFKIMLNLSTGKQKFNVKGIKLLPIKAGKASNFLKKSLKKKFFNQKKLKKNFNFIKKKKKLSLLYKIFSLNNQSFFYKLRRKILKNFLKSKEKQNILKLKLKLKQLHFLNDKDIFKSRVLLIDKKDNEFLPSDYQPIALQAPHLKKKIKFFLSITIHANNIFMNLAKYFKKNIFKTVKFWSAGMFDFICSKTKLKFAISAMLKEVKSQLKQLKIYTIKIKAPKYLNKYIFKQLSRLLYKPKFFIYSSFKIFNGCRSQKKRRKKRLKFRFFR
jgi:hypothetical protein